MVDRGGADWQGADVRQGIVRAVRAVEGSNCSGLLGMSKDGPPMRCSPIDSERLRVQGQGNRILFFERIRQTRLLAKSGVDEDQKRRTAACAKAEPG